MYITEVEYETIRDEIKADTALLCNRLIDSKKLGYIHNDLVEAVIEISGYSFAVDTWEQVDISYEGQTNYMSADQLRAMYSRALILKGVK